MDKHKNWYFPLKGSLIALLCTGSMLLQCHSDPPILPAGWYQPQAPLSLRDLPESIANNPALEAIQIGSGPLSSTWDVDHTQIGSLAEMITQKQQENLTHFRDLVAASSDSSKDQLLAEIDESLSVLVQQGLELRSAYFSDSIQSDLFRSIVPSGIGDVGQTKSALISDGGQEVLQNDPQKGQRQDWHPRAGSIQVRPEGVFHKFLFTNLTLEKYRKSDYGWELQANLTLPDAYAAFHLNEPQDIFGWGCYEVKSKNGRVNGQTTNIPTEASYYIDSPFGDNISIVNKPVQGCFAGEKWVQSVGIGARFPGKLDAEKTYYMWIPGRWRTEDSLCRSAAQTENVIVGSGATVEARNQGGHWYSVGRNFLCSCKDGYQTCMFKAGCNSTGADYCDANEAACPTNDRTNDENRMVCYPLQDAAPGNSNGVVNYEVSWHINFCALPNGDSWSANNQPCCDNSDCSVNTSGPYYCDLDPKVGGGYCKRIVVPSCTDGSRNGNESDTDCGGSCPKCSNGKACGGATDCQSGLCSGGRCQPMMTPSSTWHSIPSGVTEDLLSVWGSSSNDVWAVGFSGRILHWNGSTWSTVTSGTSSPLYAVWGSGKNDVWAMGGFSTVLHWDGTSWTMASIPPLAPPMRGIFGIASNDVWAVGENSTSVSIMHWNGASWSTSYVDSQHNWIKAWASGATNAWAVGYDKMTFAPALLHWDGASWNPASLPGGATRSLQSIWGNASNNIWVGDDSGSLLHYDGAGWNWMNLGTLNNIYGIWGSASNDIWAVGSNHTVAHWDGTRWTVMSMGGPPNLQSLWGFGLNDIWAVGSGGAILHFSP